VYVRNATSTPATLTTLYVNGVLQTFTSQIVSGNTVTVVDLSSFNITAGQEVMLVTEEGTQIRFKAKF